MQWTMHLLWPPDFGIATELILMCPLIHDTYTVKAYIYIYVYQYMYQVQ